MVARIGDRLAASFGNANVFMDVDNLLAGRRFDRELAKALGHTDVLLRHPPTGWTYSTDAAPQRYASLGLDATAKSALTRNEASMLHKAIMT